jgi:predicted TIM-barrel fold metal-dependent hydrolase
VRLHSPLLGTPVDVELPARRVVSLVSSATELLFAFGAGASVVGVSPYFFGADLGGYLPLDLDEVARRRPEVFVVFQEPEHPVDPAALVAERGWDRAFAPRTVCTTVERGKNLIHDGPSFAETARWLRGALLG